MEKTGVLLVAEKPSTAGAIAAVLGKFTRKDGYLEGDGWLAGWCLGHLVEDAPAKAYDERFAKWKREDLPIIPEEWKYQVLSSTVKQYNILTNLMNAWQVSEIWNCCDSGREGELIFRLVYNQCGCGKPVRRLWISSMEESAIRKGLDNLRDGAEYDCLYQAAVCRSHADWLVGINATRLFSLVYPGGTLNVGRVMTPTLALIAGRENSITDFQKEKFYTVELELPGLKAVSERFSSRRDAEKLRVACQESKAVVRTVKHQEKRENPPKLYDLTTLQRDANRLLGYTAKQTLDFLQSLYEKKLMTYPRTDSRYLTEDMSENLPGLCEKTVYILPLLAGKTIPVNAGQVIDSSRVGDHHALIPTAEIEKVKLRELSEGERLILRMVTVRLLCAVGEPCEYIETTVSLECGGASFSAKGRTVTAEGWKATEKMFMDTLKRGEKTEESVQSLPPLTEGEIIEKVSAKVKEGTTKPPARFTEDTLLSAMERAGAEDFAGIENPERAGLGTPATRAGMIEKLIRTEFVRRKDRQLIPTEKGMNLIKILPEQLKSAKLTAEWEEKLKQVEYGNLNPDVFLSGIASMLTELVHNFDNVTSNQSVVSRRPVVGICPRCGRNVVEGKKSFFCEGHYEQPPCGFALWKNNRFFVSKGKEITKRVAEKLLKDGRIHMTKLHSDKKGTDYDATIIMEDTGGKYVSFRLEFDLK